MSEQEKIIMIFLTVIILIVGFLLRLLCKKFEIL